MPTRKMDAAVSYGGGTSWFLMDKKLLIFFIVIAIIVAVFFCWMFGWFPAQRIEKNIQGDDSGGNFSVQEIKIQESEVKTLIFVGDIMLDRGVEHQIRKNNNFQYPFLYISDFLKEADLVIGNLEGPVVDDPQEFAIDSLKFNFDKRVLEGLNFANISLVSLANNHTLNRDAEGLRQTRKNLDASGINYFGDPKGCDAQNVTEREGMLFIGINKTYPFNCSNEQIRELVNDLKVKNPEKLLVIFMHWGEEYQQANVYQKNLGYLMIDAGADLVVGTHPHVTQEVEKYKDKYIAYSLGNFVFDQNFSKETMEGIVLKVTVNNNKIEKIELVNIEINKTFQPYIK